MGQWAPENRILVVDDDQIMRESIRALLTSCGFLVITAGSCEEALSLVESSVPDLILSDVNMPCADGFDLLRALRERTGTAEVPVIFVTGMGGPDDRETCLAAGANDHLPKPVQPERLLEVVRGHLKVA